MDIYSRYKLAVWGVAILVVLNITTLSIIWYMYLRKPPPPPRLGGDHSPAELLIQDLEFDEEQAQSYLKLREEHMRWTDSTRAMIRSLGQQMVDELFKSSPDSVRAQQLFDSLGGLHARFEQKVYEHFLEIKNFCNPQQQEKLRRLVHRALVDPKSAEPPPGFRPPPGNRRQPPPENASR